MTVQAQTQKILITNKLGRQMWVWDSDSFYTQRLKSGPYQKQNLMHLRDLCPTPRKILDIGMNMLHLLVKFTASNQYLLPIKSL